MANVNITDGGIPERTLTLQFKPLGATNLSDLDEKDVDTPSVAGGNEIKLYAQSIKEIFKKEPQFQSIQKGKDNHFEGDKTLVVDTMKAKHTFEITAYVYSKGDDSTNETEGDKIIHSLPPYDIKASKVQNSHRNGDGTATVTGDKIKAGKFGEAQPLGDPGIVYGSVEVEGTNSGLLDEGTDYEIDYDRGEITFLDNGITSKDEKVQGPFGIIDLGDKTVITETFEVKYDYEVSAQNIASQIRKMAQLGNPMVMRLDEKTITAADGEKSARGYLVTPKAVNIVSETEKPAQYKIELELRKGGVELS